MISLLQDRSSKSRHNLSPTASAVSAWWSLNKIQTHAICCRGNQCSPKHWIYRAHPFHLVPRNSRPFLTAELESILPHGIGNMKCYLEYIDNLLLKRVWDPIDCGLLTSKNYIVGNALFMYYEIWYQGIGSVIRIPNLGYFEFES